MLVYKPFHLTISVVCSQCLNKAASSGTRSCNLYEALADYLLHFFTGGVFLGHHLEKASIQTLITVPCPLLVKSSLF